MQTQQPVELISTEPTRPPRRNRGPLVALATAAAVLLIGVVFAIASLGGDRVEPDPATTPPPETTTAPTTAAPVINPEEGAAALIGRTWTVVDGIAFSRPDRIEFAEDGTYQVFDAGIPVDSGVATYDGDVVTFESDPRESVAWVFNDAQIRVIDSCEGVVGQYRVVFDVSARAVLDVISDGCRTRVGVANGLQLEPAQS